MLPILVSYFANGIFVYFNDFKAGDTMVYNLILDY
jgi:hypothetical protein